MSAATTSPPLTPGALLRLPSRPGSCCAVIWFASCGLSWLILSSQNRECTSIYAPPRPRPVELRDGRVARHGATSANAVGKMPDVLPASGLMIGFAVLFTSVDPAAGFTPCSSLPLQRAPGPVHAPAPDAPPGRLVSLPRGRLVSFSLPPSPWQHHARAACLMQTLQPNAEAARLAKLKVPQLREELGNLGLVKGGNKTVLIQRLLAQPGESSAPHLHQHHRLPPCVSETTKRGQ